MKMFRMALLFFINVVVILWLAIVYYVQEESDTNGIFVFLGLGFLVVFDLYAWIVHLLMSVFVKKSVVTEVVFGAVILTPFLVLWYYTS